MKERSGRAPLDDPAGGLDVQSPQLVTFDAILPAAMALRAEQTGINRVTTDPLTSFVLSILAGALIAFGAIFATTAASMSRLRTEVGSATPSFHMAWCVCWRDWFSRWGRWASCATRWSVSGFGCAMARAVAPIGCSADRRFCGGWLRAQHRQHLFHFHRLVHKGRSCKRVLDCSRQNAR